jgi:Multicopper oxidase
VRKSNTIRKEGPCVDGSCCCWPALWPACPARQPRDLACRNLFSGTNDFDVHSPHWHGNTVVIHDMRTDVASIAPMEVVVADMVPDDPGTWLFHCHASFHLTEGMQVKYPVTE